MQILSGELTAKLQFISEIVYCGRQDVYKQIMMKKDIKKPSALALAMQMA